MHWIFRTPIGCCNHRRWCCCFKSHQELEFKSLLFRKMLDGRLGTVWQHDDEVEFKRLLSFKKGPVVPTRKIPE